MLIYFLAWNLFDIPHFCLMSCVSWICGLLFYQFNWLNGLEGRVFANGLGNLDLISGRVIPKTLKMVLDTYLLNTQQYKVHIKGKVEPSWEKIHTLP